MSPQDSQGATVIAGVTGVTGASHKAGPRPTDPVDAMLRGRYAQESFTVWVLKRICDLYPK